MLNFKWRFNSKDAEKKSEEMKQRLSKLLDQLSREKSQLAAILSSMEEGVLAVDLRSRIILANPAIERQFGFLEPEAIGKSVRQVVLNNQIADRVEEVLKKNVSIEEEIEIIVPFAVVFSAHIVPMQNAKKELIGAICVLRDITRLKKLEKYRSDFVANVSHELRTPLTAIKSLVETLQDGALNDPQNNLKFLQKISRQVDNLSLLITDILMLSTLEKSQKATEPFARISLNNLIAKAIDTIYPALQSKSISLVRQEEKGIEILAVEDQIYRALLNLLDNAVKYTPNKGKITVTLKKEGQKILVSVADTGVGIALDHLPHIFERFYRVDKARSRDAGGTGLGLSIVKHIMQMHKGEVLVESTEGKGSIFTLVFPI